MCELWEKFCNDFKSGDIIFLDFENYFFEIEKMEIIRELKFIVDIFCMYDNKWMEERFF